MANIKKRPPIVAVMGHIDHGKSTLLDTIRNTSVVDSEHGGITQHVSAYEVTHDRGDGDETITFLDTPGHEAFGAIRGRGAKVADVAVLVVAADDGVMEQTKEALKAIQDAGTPFVVAINKIDKAGADAQKTKQSLLESEVMVEEYGGEIPAVEVSALNNTGIDDLLENILLLADVEELTYDADESASGYVLESDIDTRRGISATLIITDGSLTKGSFVATPGAYAPVRIMENFKGENLDEATPSSPIAIIGWNELPLAGQKWQVFEKKTDAEAHASTNQTAGVSGTIAPGADVLPLTIKADAAGSLDAVIHEINKIDQENFSLTIVKGAIGNISKEDIEFSAGNNRSIVVGFGVKVDNAAKQLADRQSVSVQSFPIIYKLVEWVKEQIELKRSSVIVDEQRGEAKVLKKFSTQRNIHVIGCRVETGELRVKNELKVFRRDNEIGKAKIKGIRLLKNEVDSVREDNECGLEVDSAIEIVPGDKLVAFETVTK